MPLHPGICGTAHFDNTEVGCAESNDTHTHLSGEGPSQQLAGTWFSVAQQGYNTTGKEGTCVVQGRDIHHVFEGRIDNRGAILNELELSNDADYAAMLTEGYRRWGIGFYREISGSFSSAIIDTRQRSLRLLRDPIALRPLYYEKQGDTVRFGSDIRQMLEQCSAPPQISERKLLELFSPVYLIDEGWSDADATMFEGIRSVPFGSSVLFRERTSPEISRYWSPPERLRRDWLSPQDCIHQFRALYLQVITEHIDTPYGIAAELSGGIDSGCNVSIAAHLLSGSDRNVDAYTAIFGSQSSSERRRVRSITDRYLNVSGHMINCDDQIGFLEGSQLQDYRTTAHPSRQNLPATFVTLAKQAHQNGARILLSGEGADWFLEGTDMIWDSLLKSGNIDELVRAFNVLRQRSGCRRALQYILKSTIPTLLPGSLERQAFLREHYESTVDVNIPDIFTPAFRAKLQDTLCEQRNQFARRKNLSCWSQTLEHELMFPPNHVWQGVPIDLEMRLPYLDRRVVEFGLSVPPEYKFRIDQKNTSHYGCRKFLQREAFRDIVPDPVISSQKKEVYGSPVNRRLAMELPLLLVHPMILCEIGIIDQKKFAEIVSVFLADQENQLNELVPWLDNLLAAEKWLRATVEEFPRCRLPAFRLPSAGSSGIDHPDQ